MSEFEGPIIMAVVAAGVIVGAVLYRFGGIWAPAAVAVGMVIGSFVPIRTHRKDRRH